MDLSLLACPVTKQELLLSPNSSLNTIDGRATYSVREGVPNFLSSKSWVTRNNARLLQLIDVARNIDYKTALEAVLEDSRYVTDASRAAYLNFLPLNEDSKVLEIGASLGQHTRQIAAKCNHVEALEVIPEQALFNKISCDQAGLKNVGVSAGGDDCSLPYKDEVFDLVIINYVLEWSAASSNLHPKEGQRLVIQECNRVLRPGGVLFLATKNRFNVGLLLGAFDEHVGFAFGNALPRWLMNLIIKIKGRPETLGYLHSFYTLRKILSKSGFRRITAKLALPDARYPIVYSGFSKAEISALQSDQKLMSSNRLTKFLVTRVPHRLIKWIAPSLVFVAEK